MIADVILFAIHTKTTLYPYFLYSHSFLPQSGFKSAPVSEKTVPGTPVKRPDF